MSITEVVELNALRRSGRVVAEALRAMEAAVAPGVTTADLDHIAERIFAHYGALSAPRKFYNFPGSTCISLNEEAVHGIPGSRKIRRGSRWSADRCGRGFWRGGAGWRAIRVRNSVRSV